MKKYSGVTTALITPFLNGKVDYSSIERLLRMQLSSGINNFVIHGTTGESPTVTSDEKQKIFDFVKSKSPAGTGFIVGTGSNSTAQTIEDSIKAEKWGADAVLVVVPYYNKPPQRGLIEHFKSVADSIDIPVILYNVPSRTITSLELESIRVLSHHPNIIGIKEASGQIEFAKKIRQACGREFLLLSGDDGTYEQFLKAGGDGVISVASHVIPQAMQKAQIQENIDLIDFLFIEANPIPVKMALHLMKVIQSPELRLPLCQLLDGHSEKLTTLLKSRGLI